MSKYYFYTHNARKGCHNYLKWNILNWTGNQTLDLWLSGLARYHNAIQDQVPE